MPGSLEADPPAARRLSTSLRCRPLAQTRAAALAVAKKLSIGNCTDGTGLDVLGVPAWFCPVGDGQGDSVRMGKGVEPMEAEVGALMEAIEIGVAERSDRATPQQWLSSADILAQFGGQLTIADLAPRLGRAWPEQRMLPVTACEDLASGTRLWMPSELLRLIPPAPAQDDEPLFGATSNGLASGNTLAEATLHGLLEVVERDSLAMDLAGPSTTWLDPLTLPPPFADWSLRWREQGVTLSVRCLPSVLGFSCLEAELLDASDRRVPRCNGYGMHPDAGIALARAITEAAQVRVHALAFPEPEASPGRPALPRSSSPSGLLPFAELTSQSFDSVESALSDMAARLRQAGLRWVLRRSLLPDLGPEAMEDLHVVKVLVPGSETPTGDLVRIGRRLATKLVQSARVQCQDTQAAQAAPMA